LVSAGRCSAREGPQARCSPSCSTLKVRYSGISLAYQLGSILGGGIAPFLRPRCTHQLDQPAGPPT